LDLDLVVLDDTDEKVIDCRSSHEILTMDENNVGHTVYLGSPFRLYRPETRRLMGHALGEPLVCHQVATGCKIIDSSIDATELVARCNADHPE
jgi:hypothetical protein